MKGAEMKVLAVLLTASLLANAVLLWALLGGTDMKTHVPEGEAVYATGMHLFDTGQSPPDGVYLVQIDTPRPLQYRAVLVEKGSTRTVAAGLLTRPPARRAYHEMACRIRKGDSGKYYLPVMFNTGGACEIDLSMFDRFAMPTTGFESTHFFKTRRVVYCLYCYQADSKPVPSDFPLPKYYTIAGLIDLTKKHDVACVVIIVEKTGQDPDAAERR